MEVDNNQKKDYKLLIDNRERNVYKSGILKTLLKKKDFSNLNEIGIEIKQLTTADFAITYKDNILILVERKTWKDLAVAESYNKFSGCIESTFANILDIQLPL